MAANIFKIQSRRARKGEGMTAGNGWKHAMEKGRKRVFPGTLLKTGNAGYNRPAIFSVPNYRGGKMVGDQGLEP